MGFLDLFLPNPSMEIARRMAMQSPTVPGGSNAPPPTGQSGGGAAAASATPSAQPGATNAQQMSTPQGPYGTPQDLGQMMVQLMRQQEGSAEFDRGLAMMTAAFDPPSVRAGMIRAMTGGGGTDAGSLMNSLIALQQYNLQNQQRQAFMTGLPQMLKDAGLNADYAPLVMANPGILGDIIKARMGITGDPGERALQAARADWMQQHPGSTEADMLKAHPEYADAISLAATRTAAATQAATEQKDRQTQMDAAKTDFQTIDAQHDRVEKLLAKLNADPDAVVQAVKSLGPTTGWGGALRGQLPTALGGLPQNVQDAAGNLVLLHNILYSEGWKGKGTRLSQQEAGRIGSSFDNLSNQALSPGEIKQQLANLTEQESVARVNAAAAAGQTVPKSKWDQVNSIYKEKGDLFAGAKPVEDPVADRPAPNAQPASANQGGPVDLRGSKDPDADFEKLPPGTEFIGPDGKRYRK